MIKSIIQSFKQAALKKERQREIAALKANLDEVFYLFQMPRDDSAGAETQFNDNVLTLLSSIQEVKDFAEKNRLTSLERHNILDTYWARELIGASFSFERRHFEERSGKKLLVALLDAGWDPRRSTTIVTQSSSAGYLFGVPDFKVPLLSTISNDHQFVYNKEGGLKPKEIIASYFASKEVMNGATMRVVQLS